MNIFKRSPSVVSDPDIASLERLRAVSLRGNLEARVYENWQPSRPVASTPRKAGGGGV